MAPRFLSNYTLPAVTISCEHWAETLTVFLARGIFLGVPLDAVLFDHSPTYFPKGKARHIPQRSGPPFCRPLENCRGSECEPFRVLLHYVWPTVRARSH